MKECLEQTVIGGRDQFEVSHLAEYGSHAREPRVLLRQIAHVAKSSVIGDIEVILLLWVLSS
jgi:hypothetical protein